MPAASSVVCGPGSSSRWVGGYASVACALWARLLGIPIVVAEQNAAPGLANRLIARSAAVSAVSFDETPLPRAVFTGNPLDPARLRVDRGEARQRLGVETGQRLVAVFGGSLGARHVNEATLDAVPRIMETDDLVLLHVLGHRDWAPLADRVEDLRRRFPRYRPAEYQDDMASLYAASELVLCRAGASTVAELTLTGTASVLVPLPGAPSDHQRANADALVRRGAAVSIPDPELDADRIVATIRDLLTDATRLEDMRAGARSLARPDAADAVAALCMEHARR